MILEKTVELVRSIYKYHKIIPPKVNRVVLGLGYTGVELYALSYSPFLGLAYTLHSEIKSNIFTKLNLAGNLTNRPLSELLD
ncbi:MAG: enolase N-terminal-like fold-containing protein [Promethearchaeota archaeon]